MADDVATFKYVPLTHDVTSMLRPALQVRMTRHSTSAVFLALVDSGASNTFLPRSFADVLGVERSECRPVAIRFGSGDGTG